MGLVRQLLAKFFPRTFLQDHDLAIVSKRISYHFTNPKLLEQALIHPSLSKEQPNPFHTYERLEFLGDAVLELIISDYLFRTFPNIPEGTLTKKRSELVNQEALSSIGKKADLPDFIKSQPVADRPIEESDAVVSDVVEAIIGAAYIDGGLTAAERIVGHLFPLSNVSDDIPPDKTNYKGGLIEYCHTHELPEPIFQTVDRSGPDHSRKYKVAVLLDEEMIAEGEGSSKKKAGQAAAKHALSRLNKNQDDMEAKDPA